MRSAKLYEKTIAVVTGEARLLNMRKFILLGLVLAVCAAAQDSKTTGGNQTSKPQEVQKTAQSETSDAPKTETKDQKLTVSEGALISQERIPSGARVYIAPMVNGFDIYISAGLQQKKVPVVVVADESKAEFEVTGVAETEKAGWAKMLFTGSQQTNETASVKMVNLKTGSVVFAYSVNKSNSARGKQSAAEACAKHIKEKIID